MHPGQREAIHTVCLPTARGARTQIPFRVEIFASHRFIFTSNTDYTVVPENRRNLPRIPHTGTKGFGRPLFCLFKHHIKHIKQVLFAHIYTDNLSMMCVAWGRYTSANADIGAISVLTYGYRWNPLKKIKANVTYTTSTGLLVMDASHRNWWSNEY